MQFLDENRVGLKHAVKKIAKVCCFLDQSDAQAAFAVSQRYCRVLLGQLDAVGSYDKAIQRKIS